MNWNDWQFAWRRQEAPAGSSADVEALRRTFEDKSRQQARALLVRDIAEISAGIFVAAVFARVAWSMGNSGWPIAAAIALVLGVCGFFLLERLRARGRIVGEDAPLLTKIDADLGELRHQQRLLRNVWLWYLGPLGCAIAIVFVTVVRATPPENPLHDPLVISGFSAFFAIALGFAWLINHRAVRARIEPRIAELEKLRAQFLAPPSATPADNSNSSSENAS